MELEASSIKTFNLYQDGTLLRQFKAEKILLTASQEGVIVQAVVNGAISGIFNVQKGQSIHDAEFCIVDKSKS